MNIEGLTEENVVSALELASSQDLSLLKTGEEKLWDYEAIPGYYVLLLSLLKKQQLHDRIRLLTALLLKNGIEQKWRGSIQDSEKDLIRKEILSVASEPNYQLALQIAVVIGKIARSDIKQWPQIITDVLQAIKSPDLLVQHRSLLVLNQITKALVSKRLYSDRLLFKRVAEKTFGYILELLAANVASFLIFASKYKDAFHSEDEATQKLELCILISKVLKKLLFHGFKAFEKDSDPMRFLQFILQNIKPVLETRNCLLQAHNKERVEKLVVIFMKVLVECQKQVPRSFVPILEMSLIFAVQILFTDDMNGLPFDQLKVQCCNLLQRVVRCKNYHPIKGSEEHFENPVCMEAYQVRRKLFTASNLEEFMKRLCFQYFPMKYEDLEIWDTDPEAFVAEETGDVHLYSLKHSSETLYLALFYEFRETVIPILGSFIQLVTDAGRTEPENLQTILERDAVYYASGLASYELFDDFNFDNWFRNHLVKELESKDPRLKYIRHRVTWVIGRWINVKFSKDNVTILYRFLTCLLDNCEDLVVKITAAQTLKAVIEDFNFSCESFLPYLEQIFPRLLDLLIQTHECDTKLAVLKVVSLIIERLRKKIRPYCHILLNYLPQYWSEATHHKMLQSAIVVTFSRLVESYGDQSEELHPVLLPVIKLSTDMHQEAHIHLLDDALELWQVLLQNSLRIAEDLLLIFNQMVPLLDRASENLRLCLAITESYIILDAQAFLQVYSKQFIDTLENLVGNLKQEGNIIVARLMELVISLFPVEGAALMQSLLMKILGVILTNEEYPPLLAVYLSIYGHLITQNQQGYMEIVSLYSKNNGKNTDDVTGALIDVWLDKVDTMTKDDRRKLSAITMCFLLPNNSRVVNERFALILDMVVNILYDATKITDLIGTDQKPSIDTPEEVAATELDEETAESKRKSNLRKQDKILTTNLAEYVKKKLQETQVIMGVTRFNELMETLDSAIAKQLMSFISPS